MMYSFEYDEVSRRRVSCRLLNNIKIELKDSDEVGGTHLIEDRMQRCTLGYAAITIRGSIKGAGLLDHLSNS
jgi:hypothetical protein